MLRIPQKSFRLEVPNISKLDTVCSPVEMIQNIPWKVKVSKRIQESQTYLGVHLYCAHLNRSLEWSYAARASFKLLPFNDTQNSVEFHGKPYIFVNNQVYNVGSGCSTLISWMDLFDKTKCYVKDDKINLMIDIEVADPSASNRSLLLLDKVDQCCKQSGLATFQLAVTNVTNLMAARSAQIILRDIPWYLTVCKENSNHLGICLQSDCSSKGFLCNIKMIVQLKSSKESVVRSIEGVRTQEKRIDYLTMERLVSWNELLDSENGFIESDIIVMEVELSASKPTGHLPNVKKRCTNSTHTDAKHIKLECGICHKAFEDQEVSFTTCGHMFCSPCIKSYVNQQNACLTCNTQITLAQVFQIHLPT